MRLCLQHSTCHVPLLKKGLLCKHQQAVPWVSFKAKGNTFSQNCTDPPGEWLKHRGQKSRPEQRPKKLGRVFAREGPLWLCNVMLSQANWNGYRDKRKCHMEKWEAAWCSVLQRLWLCIVQGTFGNCEISVSDLTGWRGWTKQALCVWWGRSLGVLVDHRRISFLQRFKWEKTAGEFM